MLDDQVMSTHWAGVCNSEIHEHRICCLRCLIPITCPLACSGFIFFITASTQVCLHVSCSHSDRSLTCSTTDVHDSPQPCRETTAYLGHNKNNVGFFFSYSLHSLEQMTHLCRKTTSLLQVGT